MILREHNILITGGSGFLGGHVVDALKQRGVAANHIFAPHMTEFDFRNKDDCARAMRDMQVVIHLAAVTGPISLHRDERGRVFYENLMMGAYLMEAARLRKVKKFVSVGSVTEYPESAHIPLREENLWQGYPVASHAEYALAKRMLAVQGGAYELQYDFCASHLILTNIYGPGDGVERGYVIPSIIAKISHAAHTHEQRIVMQGDGNTTRDFLYVQDAAEAIVLAAERYEKSEPVNLGSETEISIKDLVAIICRLMHFQGTIHWDVSMSGGRSRIVVNTDKAKKEFGFKAAISLEEGLAKTIEWNMHRSVTT